MKGAVAALQQRGQVIVGVEGRQAEAHRGALVPLRKARLDRTEGLLRLLEVNFGKGADELVIYDISDPGRPRALMVVSSMQLA